jgi:hypothetical protein
MARKGYSEETKAAPMAASGKLSAAINEALGVLENVHPGQLGLPQEPLSRPARERHR